VVLPATVTAALLTLWMTTLMMGREYT